MTDDKPAAPDSTTTTTLPPAASVPEAPRAGIVVGAGLDWPWLAWMATVVGTLALLIVLLNSVRTVAVPLLVAFILAYILDPVVDRFEARGIGRTPAILILLAGVLGSTVAIIAVVGPQIVREFAQIPAKVRELIGRVMPWAQATFDIEIPQTIHDAVVALQARIAETEAGFAGLAAPAGDVLATIYGGTVGVLAALASIAMIPVFQFFFLRDFDLIVARVKELIPQRHREPISARMREIDQTLSSFIRGQLIVASILAVLYTLGLWIVGIPLALVVGLISGLGNMVPYLGTTVGLTLATVMALLEWQGVPHLLAVYAVFAVVQFLEGWVITPRIVGESVGLSSFVVIVAVLVFGELFGFFGVLIAVPLAAVLKILLRAVLEHYRESAFYRGARST